MKRLITCAAVLLALAGCQSTPDEPDQTTVLAGDYQALSNCFYRQVATTPGFAKSDQPATRTSTVTGRTADRIDFIAEGDGITRVHARLGSPGAGTAWAGYLSHLKQCEQPTG